MSIPGTLFNVRQDMPDFQIPSPAEADGALYGTEREDKLEPVDRGLCASENRRGYFSL